ncbi:MAG: response regulator, partial [Chloroflexota bacterium]
SMPVVDGWGFIQNLQHEPPTLRDIPVVALTAHAMRGDRGRAIAAGFQNYLAKPLTADTFINDLMDLLEDIPSLQQYLHRP